MAVMFRGSIPQAYSVHSGAPDPPENLDHYGVSEESPTPSRCKKNFEKIEVERCFACATHHVLMWIHEHSKAPFLDLIKHLYQVLDVLQIVLARTLMFERLPSEDESEHVEPPRTESREVGIRGTIVEIERSTDEGQIARLGVFPEVLELVGWLAERGFGRTGEVDAAKEDGAAGGVPEESRGRVQVGRGDGAARGGRGGGWGRAHDPGGLNGLGVVDGEGWVQEKGEVIWR